ncbi:hypothetical protein PIB30_052573 [Stylosanthes scabra]|uniref:Uncharacterized protein n=1 Tax=Stylosanthes scabra TaxID=79078 RepID=A0ABU6YJF0_9FABA|nr:hypothetical protein [Stylosanthes scabra]
MGFFEHEQNSIMLGSATVSLGRDESGNLTPGAYTSSATSSARRATIPATPSARRATISAPPEEEVIDISSSSEDEHESTPSRPQEEENRSADEEQHIEANGRPTQTQSVVEVIPIYPTQEVVDISSSSDDEPEPTPIQVIIPKTKVDLVSSPRAKSITDVLLRMSKEHLTYSEPDNAPSFDLGINYGTGPQQTQEEHLLTTQDVSEIEELDELIRKKGDQFQTPQPTQSLNS